MPSPAPVSPSPAPARSNGVALAVLLVAIFAAYANTLHAPFVYDDTLAIPENQTIRRLWPLSDVLLPKVEGGVTVSGRPMLNLSFALNHAISGNAPWSYHVTNILIHAGAALLLFGLVRRTLARTGTAATGTGERLALAVAALWALHPLQTQAITYVVQRAESMMGFFYLFTVYAFVRGLDAGDDGRMRRRWWAVSIGACVLGVGTKEVMATAPLLVLLYDRTFAAGSFAGALRGRRGYFAALFATWLVLAALLATTGGNRGGTVGLGVGLPLWAYPLTQFQALARYLGLAFWPSPLVFEYGTFWVKSTGDILPYALVVLPLLAATIFAVWRRPALGFLGVWFFLILAPTSLAPGTIQMIVEHRMYLPLAAVATAVVLGAWRLAGPKALAGFGVIALALAVATAARNHDYRSNLALWSDTVAKRPLNPRAHQGVAEALEAAGRFDEAIKVRQEAIRLLPDESQYHYNLALTLSDAGKLDEAMRHYQLSLQLFPNEPRTHNNLAVLLVKQGRNAEALTHYAEAVRLRPGDAQYHYNHGVALMRERRPAEARASYETALRLKPDHADAHYNLAALDIGEGRLAEALAHYDAALRAKPGEPEYGAARGNALIRAGRLPDALAQFEAVLAQHPQSIDALYGAGSALAALGRPEDALARFEAVLRAAPGHTGVRFKLGNTLLDLGRMAEAISQFEALLRLTPHDAEAHHNLGIAFARLERWDEARQEFDEALRLKPDYAGARKSREQLRQVTGR